MAEEILRRNLESAFDPGPIFPNPLLLSRTMALLATEPAETGHARRSRRLKQRSQQQALAFAAALLAIVIVATLLFAARQRETAPVSPGPYPVTPYTIPSPPLATSSCGSVPRQWASSPPNPAKMLSATTGWAYGPMRTTDGGANWLDVSPPSVPGRTNKNDEFFLDATHAWVAETATSSAACIDHVVIFRTADGGRTWQPQDDPPLPVWPIAPTDVMWTGINNHAQLLDFIDPQNGWLLLGSGPPNTAEAGVSSSWIGAPWRKGGLWQTNDGGATWAVAPNPGAAIGCVPTSGEPAKATMSFLSASSGWMLAACELSAYRANLLVTHDSGASWSRATTPLAPEEAPEFFDSRHGVAKATGGLIVTSDGGASWTVRALPGGAIGAEFINPNEGWAATTGDNEFQCSLDDLVPCNHNFRLYHTSDGGKTWVPGNFTSLAMPAPKWWPPAYLHFVDARTGFASTGEDPGDSGLFRTTDAGLKWTRVDGTIQGR